MTRISRLRNLLPAYSTSHNVDPLRHLTSKCRENLRAIHFTMHQIDILAAREICSFTTVLQKCGETDPENALLPENDYAKLKADSIQLLKEDEDLGFRDRELTEILGELSEMQSKDLERCQSVATALLRIQSRFIMFDGNINNVGYCRNRAENFLVLAKDSARLLTSVAKELHDFDQRLVFAIKFRLTALTAFSPIWATLTPAEEKMPQNMSRGSTGLSIWLERLNRELEKEESSGIEYTNSLHKWDPTLIAITIIVLISCVALLALAWQHSPSAPGTLQDSDFYFLVQAAMMQALSIFTVMLTLGRRAPFQAWKWAWAFAVLGAVSIVASVILYNLVQPWWSGLCTFFAAASQAAITLQIMLTVDSTWRDESAKQKQS